MLTYRLINFDDTFGVLTIENNTRLQFSISKSILELTGQLGIWYRSLVLKDNDGNTICSTIMVCEYLIKKLFSISHKKKVELLNKNFYFLVT